MIIPIPPNHCRIARHSNILFGISSKFEIIVEPVVVIPDMLSKKAFINEKFKSEKTNGNDPNIATLSHESAVNKKACCKFSFFSWVRFDKKNRKLLLNKKLNNKVERLICNSFQDKKEINKVLISRVPEILELNDLTYDKRHLKSKILTFQHYEEVCNL